MLSVEMPPAPRSSVVLLWLALAVGCSSSPDVDPRYRPAESVLEVVAVLRRHVPDDTYRFEPARDFTGRNVYRSSLLRLESLERVHAEALRAGYMDGVIVFSKGRALERLRAYDLAADAYRLAAEVESELRVEALYSADVCDGLHEVASNPVEPGTLASAGDPSRAVEEALQRFDERDAQLDDLDQAAGESHYVFVIQEEIERNDVARAKYCSGLRKVLPDGDVRAVSELQRVVIRHGESQNSSRHMLALAGLYEDMAIEYVDANPPESPRFDPVRFQELIDTASRLYEVVASEDGKPEKLEAARKLEAFLAFALGVDRDRFTP